MFEKLPRVKVFRDPLYNYIRVDYKIIDDLIDTKEMQRLRRIRQLAGLSMVFHTAEHSRFCHSLGAYEMARKIIETVDDIKTVMSEYEQVLFMAATLLHDVGHGPYSHAFEHVTSVSHEQMGVNIILGDTEINKVLSIVDGLAEDIADVIAHGGKFPVIENLTSSQLDVDRMDYLQRDSYFTGALYGTIDAARIIRSMKIVDNQVTYRASGASAVESYLMNRYHMYWQVYYHKVARSYELVLQSIFNRIKDLYKGGITIDADIDDFIKVMEEQNLDAYFNLDDAYVNAFIKQLAKSNDDVLCNLCNSLLNRKLFNVIDCELETDQYKKDKIKKEYASDPILNRYYYYESSLVQAAYLHSDDDMSLINDIKISLPNKEIVSLEDYSPIIKGLIESANKKVDRIFYGKLGEYKCINK